MNLNDELQRLQELHSMGTLSDEEFTKAKGVVLERFANPESINQVGQTNKTGGLSANQWATLLHLAQLTNFIFPCSGIVISVCIWQLKKEEFPILDAHGKNMANWIISSLIGLLLSAVLTVILIGGVFIVIILGCSLVFPIIAAFKASEGKVWKYPLSSSFFK